MTVALVDPSKFPQRSVGNGVTTVFPFQWKALSSSDIKVYVAGILQTEGVNYTVSGLGLDAGGSVTFISGAPANGLTVIIMRSMQQKRTTDYQQQGDFLSDTVNPDFDNAVMLIQDLAEQVSRCLQGSVLDPLTSTSLSKTAFASQFLSVDVNGNVVPSSGTGSDAGLRTDLINALTSLVGSRALTYKQATRESGVGVTPIDFSEKWLDSPRYGDVADGTTDVAAALTNADKVGPIRIECGTAYGTHLISSNLTFTNRPHILPGEILKPNTGVSITFNKFPDAHPSEQIFDLSVVNDGTKIVWPTYDRWEVPAAWFGAIPDADANKHDQQKYIQYCIDSLGARGGIVKLAGGDYYCSDTFNVKNNTIIRGTGYASTGLRVSSSWGASTSFVTFINGTSAQFGCRLEDLNVDGNSIATVTKLIDAQSWNELCGLYFVWIRNFMKNGLYLSHYYGGSANSHLHGVQIFESASATGANRACIFLEDPGFSSGWFQLHCKEVVVVGNATDGQTNTTGIVAQGRSKILASGIHGEKVDSIIATSGAASVNGHSVQSTGNATVNKVFSYGSTATGKIHVTGANQGGATFLVRDNRATYTNMILNRAESYSEPLIHPPDPGRAIAGGKFVGTATPSISYAQGLSAIARQAAGQFRITHTIGLNDSTAYDVVVENYHSASLAWRVVNSTNTFDVFFTNLSGTATDPDAFAVKVYHRAGGSGT